jgi:hypothetical protein
VPGRGALFPSTAEASGHRHLRWALPKVLHAVSEIKRLAASTRGNGYRMVRYFNRKRNPTQTPGKRACVHQFNGVIPGLSLALIGNAAAEEWSGRQTKTPQMGAQGKCVDRCAIGGTGQFWCTVGAQ